MSENKGKAEGNRGRRGKGVMSYKERYRSTVVEDERIIVHRSRRLLKTMTPGGPVETGWWRPHRRKGRRLNKRKELSASGTGAA